MRMTVMSVIFVMGIAASMPQIHAESAVSIEMEKTTYGYCEKLFYTINVARVTGDPAIIHIIDESGKSSSAIPIEITGLQNPIPSLVPFEAEIFPLGKYVIDVQYAGATAQAEFELIESDSVCIPEIIKPIMANWLSGNISDGFLLDAFQKYVDDGLVDIPFKVNQDNLYDITIPKWVKNIGYWWLEGAISDDDLSGAMNYLLQRDIIGLPTDTENWI